MRPLLLATSVVVLTSLLALAVSPSLQEIGAAVSPSQQITMTFGMIYEPDSLNPFVAVLPASWYVLDIVYDLLVGFGPNYEPVPQLAQSWSVSPDNHTWTFNLFHNATWHDGTPLTARDVEWTYEFVINNSAGRRYKQLAGIYPASGYTSAYANAIEAVDDYTVEITTIVPKANLVSLWIPILQKAEWSSFTPGYANVSYLNNPPTGSGPWVFDTWVPWQYIQLHANTNYHLATPKFDVLIMKSYSDPVALLADLKAGAIDATNYLTEDQWTGLQGFANIRRFAVGEIGFTELALNSAPEWALRPGDGANFNRELRNMSVRKALAQVIDKQFLVETVRSGLGPTGSSLIPPATAYWHYAVPDYELYRFNLAAANATLDPWYRDTDGDGVRENLTGPSRELSFTLHMPSSYVQARDAMAYYIEWARQVGIKITPIEVTERQIWELTLAANFDLFVWAWGGRADPDFLLSVMTTEQIPSQGGLLQDVWYSNPEYDALYDLQSTQTNLSERQATVFRMQQILYHDTPYIILWYYTGLYAVRTDTFSNWPDFTRYPNLAIFGMGNGFMFLQVTPGPGAPNTPPYAVDAGGPYTSLPSNVTRTYTGTARDDEDTQLNFTWSFGDGTAAQKVTATSATGSFSALTTHVYTRPGTYTLGLAVADGAGNVATASTSVLVVSDTTAPVASAAASPNPAEAGAPVDFSGIGSTDDVAIVNWTWTFAEKSTLHVLYGVMTSWTFTEPGIWNVTLTVRDAAGNLDTDWVEVVVRDITAPIADAGPDLVVGQGGAVILSGVGSTDDVAIVSYTWTIMRDGIPITTLTGAPTSYRFEEAGIYSISLIVRDAAGNSGTDMMVVTVEAPSFLELYWLALALGLGGAVVAGALLFLRRRR